MIIGGTPVNVNNSHDKNDDTVVTKNNNDETNINKEPSSSSHAVTLHYTFSGDDHDDVDCMNKTKNDVITLANECHDDNGIE